EREEQQCRGDLVGDLLEDGVQQLDRVGGLGVQVGVGEDAALGAAGGAGGVADRRDAVRGEGGAPPGDLLVGHVPAEGGEPVEGPGVDLPQAGVLGVGRRGGGDGGGVLRGLGDDVAGAG